MSGRPAGVPDAGGFFSLLDERLKLGTEAYSPAVLAKVEYAGGNHVSFAMASVSMARLAETPISSKHVQRLTERLGKQRQQQRDQQVAAMKAGTLQPQYKQAPAVVAVHVDAGKVQFRQEEAGVGVHAPHWGDVKVACLQTYARLEGKGDPQPNPPAVFLDPPRVLKLVNQMERVRSHPDAKGSPADGAALFKPRPRRQPIKRIRRPRRLMRTVVASTANVEEFGWMVAAEAMARNFYGAARKAVVGDGGNWIGPLGEMHFPEWVQVLDFLHLLVHLYAAGMAVYRGQPKAAWELYEKMLRDAWAGRAAQVVEALEKEAARMGPAPPKASADDARRIVWGTLAYVKANTGRMDYARYRSEGLPVTSALVESLVKQINFRMKGTEKFWLEGGAEAVLQVRAAYLSDDSRAEEFFQHRPRGPAVGRNRRLVTT